MTFAAVPAGGQVNYTALVQPDRVHGRLYYDPEVFNDELERLWYREWVYIGHDSEVPESGDYCTKKVGRQPLIMSRGGDGAVHVLLNRCAHRGNTVCQESSGNANTFRCAYHGWTYRNSGELLGVPFPRGYDDSFRKSDYALATLPRVESYRGFVFGSFTADGRTLEEHLGRARESLDRLCDLSPTGRIALECWSAEARVPRAIGRCTAKITWTAITSCLHTRRICST